MRSESARTQFDLRIVRSRDRVAGWTVAFVLGALALAAVAGLAIAFLRADGPGDAERQQENGTASNRSRQGDGFGESARQRDRATSLGDASMRGSAGGGSPEVGRAVIGQRSDRWSIADVANREGESWSDRRQRLAGQKVVRNRDTSTRSKSGFAGTGGRSDSRDSPERRSADGSETDEAGLNEQPTEHLGPVDLLDVITPGFAAMSGVGEGFEIYALNGKNARWPAEVEKRLSDPDLPDPVAIDLVKRETGETIRVLIPQQDLTGTVLRNRTLGTR